MHVENAHHIMEIVGVLLYNFHRLQILQAGLLAKLVFAIIGITSQVPDVCDVADMADLVTQVSQVAIDDIEGQKGSNIA